jgi:phosphoglycolate phosphatase
MPALKKIIFYDLDGTLVDTREDICLAANHMLRQMGSPQLSHEEIASYVGRGVFHLISHCLKSEDVKRVEKGTKIYRAYYGEHMLDHSRIFPGTLEILEHFKPGVQLVFTNKPNPFSYDLLKALGVVEFFKEVLAGGGDYPKKPDPAGILAMLEKFKVSAEQALFIGDSLVDIETARNAKIDVAVITHGFSDLETLQSASPDMMAADFPDLMRQIKIKGW